MTEGDPRPSLQEFLEEGVDSLAGVGPRRQEQLGRLGIVTLGDLLHHFPARHEDLRWDRTREGLVVGESRTVPGALTSLSFRAGVRDHWRGRWITELEHGATLDIGLVWFQGPRRRPPIERGWQGRVSGVLREAPGDGARLQIVQPRIARAGGDAGADLDHDRVVPTYPLVEGLTAGRLRRWISTLLADPRFRLDFESSLAEGVDGTDLQKAYHDLHFPGTLEGARRGRESLSRFELAIVAHRQQEIREKRQRSPGLVVEVTREIDRRIRRRFPFEFTAAQNRVIGEIVSDLRRGPSMERLIQGDVGCGKTAVAIYAALAVVAGGRQVAFLAPTAALAVQHHRSLVRSLEGSRVVIELLTGAGSGSSKRHRTRAIEDGTVDLVVGTHALLSRGVGFARLGLVIVDEEQRFGVRQRAVLGHRAAPRGVPHALHLSATPIPRTLASAVFGELDISTIESSPAGRPPVGTHRVEPGARERALRFVASELERGHRAVFVVPRIEDEAAPAPETGGSTGTPPSVTRVAKALAHGPLHRFPPGILHGRLGNERQIEILEEFRTGRRPLLVATAVVEVGLDVPELTVVWIEDAHCFGLTQLHQLRGRTGRSARRSWCFFSGPSDGSPAEERLRAFSETSCGFRLAAEDLRLRGAGEEFGVAQSGLPPHRLCHPLQDLELFREVQASVVETRRGNPGRLLKGWQPLFEAFCPARGRPRRTDPEASCGGHEAGGLLP